MTMERPESTTQWEALMLIVLGALITWLACHDNYAELKTLGSGVCGAGLQAFVSVVKSDKIS